MRPLKRRHVGGHIYKPGGVGELEFDPAECARPDHVIVGTRDLPGFATDHVTYKSHHFWIHWLKWIPAKSPDHSSGVLIRVHHGAGWEVWEGDGSLARALAAYGDDDRGAFLLCWFLLDQARETYEAGKHHERQRLFKAFVDGRLKKRKRRGGTYYKVWVEPEAEAVTG